MKLIKKIEYVNMSLIEKRCFSNQMCNSGRFYKISLYKNFLFFNNNDVYKLILYIIVLILLTYSFIIEPSQAKKTHEILKQKWENVKIDHNCTIQGFIKPNTIGNSIPYYKCDDGFRILYNTNPYN